MFSVSMGKSSKMILYFALVICVGMVLIILGGKNQGKTKTDTQQVTFISQKEAEEALEARVTALLSGIAGVGRVQVMITLDCGNEGKYLQNEQQNTDSVSKSYITVQTENGQSPVLASELYSRVRGVAVVCDGGRDPAVEQAVMRTLEALFDIGSHHISVCGAT